MTDAQHSAFFRSHYSNLNAYESTVRAHLVDLGDSSRLSTSEQHAVITGFETELTARDLAIEILDERMTAQRLNR